MRGSMRGRPHEGEGEIETESERGIVILRERERLRESESGKGKEARRTCTVLRQAREIVRERDSERGTRGGVCERWSKSEMESER